jgi:hypothetical protein
VKHTRCSTCNQTIADDSPTCPHCGVSRVTGWGVLALVAIFFPSFFAVVLGITFGLSDWPKSGWDSERAQKAAPLGFTGGLVFVLAEAIRQWKLRSKAKARAEGGSDARDPAPKIRQPQ